MKLEAKTAIVYQGANRRYFTKDAAYRSFAWKRIFEKHSCQCEGDVGYDCGMHTPEEIKRLGRVCERLVSRMKRYD